MIISASYRTDIPAFYSEWFMNRLRAGSCQVVNPYSGKANAVDLRPEVVDGIVFWTKNLGPLLPRLDEVRERGYPFVVQYTITGYPRELEERVVHAERAIEHLRVLSQRYGGDVEGRRVFAAVWRYDPILVTNRTPLAWHVENFTRLADQLAGTTDEVIFSFAHLYQKTLRALRQKRADAGVIWDEHERIMGAAEGTGQAPAEALQLIATLAAIAREHGMSLRGCSQPEFLIPGVAPARCVDNDRLIDVAGAWGMMPPTHLRAVKEKGNRVGCECAESRDIGAYDTCPHGCVYCYAVRDRGAALRRHRAHDPNGEFLIAPSLGARDQEQPLTSPTSGETSARGRAARPLPLAPIQQASLFESGE